MAKIGLAALLKAMVEQSASDLHITNGVPPQFRIHGKMVKVKIEPLTSTETKELCYSVLTDTQKADFEKNLELDFSFGIRDLSRFRGNLFFQRGAVAAVFRRIPMVIPEFDSLGLPQILKRVIRRPNGLILVTGPTGSGKSTSLASMLDILNREEFGHIMTVEDPIEFVHPHKNCIINQREIGVDTRGFGAALKRVLRQDPDYVFVGEMRDVETIETALTLAETGHLVFGTLHTNGAVQSINRIINVFPPHQQPQIRAVLSFSLQAIMSQQLLPRLGEAGRVAACEVLIPNPAIRNMIREDKIHQLYSAMQAGQGESGMQTMNQALAYLALQRIVSKADAMDHSSMPEELQQFLGTREQHA
ncbi:MAG TPA: type IV pili twitching motility protein PilT [Bdellovibrionales bacterium]|nr:MAG: type IV pili twitching motility protein PilT [Bdellovibrionales bacterium GWA1_52_35]OFZ39562.1 MAG: type IV pili twitching motility protein PilT [Bdellovibrionales bacterium GWC1_52_8]HAR41687.1 type IV pili twitching motility protein PilT [Bdellovibrionales bacterium]HCM41396.1 type IV pili twitching motility protein PilT [Bdellovibrionales bacterium]